MRVQRNYESLFSFFLFLENIIYIFFKGRGFEDVYVRLGWKKRRIEKEEYRGGSGRCLSFRFNRV